MDDLHLPLQVKFIYSEKATKFCKISTFLLSVCTIDKSKVEISQKILAFSEYTNFNIISRFPSFGKLRSIGWWRGRSVGGPIKGPLGSVGGWVGPLMGLMGGPFEGNWKK